MLREDAAATIDSEDDIDDSNCSVVIKFFCLLCCLMCIVGTGSRLCTWERWVLKAFQTEKEWEKEGANFNHDLVTSFLLTPNILSQ